VHQCLVAFIVGGVCLAFGADEKIRGSGNRRTRCTGGTGGDRVRQARQVRGCGNAGRQRRGRSARVGERLVGLASAAAQVGSERNRPGAIPHGVG